MCIAILTTAHPDYPLILISNRDEYLNRPTAAAAWWDAPHSQVLGGRDLYRPVKGTWLGITKQGRIAVLTNFREEGQALIQGAKSRGAIVNAFLTTEPSSDETPREFAERLVEEHSVTGVGGFSLIFGRLRRPPSSSHGDGDGDASEDDKGNRGLAVLSNRTPSVSAVRWLATRPGETHALSNSHFGDRSWPKVVHGEEMLKDAVAASTAKTEGKDALIARLFRVLSHDTLPRKRPGEEWEVYLRQLRHSIFVPLIGGETLVGKTADQVRAAGSLEEVDVRNQQEQGASEHEHLDVNSGTYGTQKQTVILVDREGHVTYVERTLFDGKGRSVRKGETDRRFEFDIEGW